MIDGASGNAVGISVLPCFFLPYFRTWYAKLGQRHSANFVIFYIEFSIIIFAETGSQLFISRNISASRLFVKTTPQNLCLKDHQTLSYNLGTTLFGDFGVDAVVE